MNDLNSKEVSDICLSCGMCCDGTLFEKANLSNIQYNDNEANVEKAKNLKMNIFEEKDKYFFKLPCHLFDKCCTVYDQVRPRVCGTYFCEPLKKYERNEQPLEAASKLIYQTLNLKRDLLKNSMEFEQFKDMKLKELIIALDPIMEKSAPEDLKKFGKMILLYASFKKARFQIINKSAEK